VVNRLAIDFRFQVTTEHRLPCLVAYLLIDGAIWAGPNDTSADISELWHSLRGDGNIFPVTCVCGNTGCAGWQRPVVVTYRPGGMVRWTVPGREADRRLVFDVRQYRAAIETAITQGKVLLSGHALERRRVVPVQNAHLLFGMTWGQLSEGEPDAATGKAMLLGA
jgi:hypothetical protein